MEPQTEPSHGQTASNCIPIEGRPDLTLELARLIELATKYPEIGPPVAELAFKAGYADFGNRLLKLGLEREAPGLEYHFVAFRRAKQARQYEEALGHCVAAARAFVRAPERYAEPEDAAKLMHLVRQGFATLLFDMKDPHGAPSFVADLSENLPKLAERFEADPFYHTLLAQLRWYSDREESERQWDRAAELGEPEFTFNARGTWYKDAERDSDKAERAYRAGLERAPRSALLRHNLAQLLLDRAMRDKDEQPAVARKLLHEADDLVRVALQEDCPRGLRRHIHNTRAELNALRQSLRPPRPRGERRAPAEGARADGAGDEKRLPERPAEERPPPEVGQVVQGRVCSLTPYGVFVTLGSGLTGLLHKSELAHEPVGDPAALVQLGQELEVKVIEVKKRDGGRPRIGLSRKALLPPLEAPPSGARGGEQGREEQPRRERPERRQGQRREEAPRDSSSDGRERQRSRPPERPPARRDERREEGRPREARGERDQQGSRSGSGPSRTRPGEDKLVSLGEMLMAKLKEQTSKG